jgi:hypothetical protein
MKKFLWTAIASLLAGAALFGGTITVTQPTGGNVAMGGSCTVAWTASNVAVNVKIQLVKPGGALVGALANNLAAGGSPWNWNVASPAVIGQQYKIRVRAVDGSAEGESAAFTVVQGEAPPLPGSISNVKLSGSSPYCLGTDHTISWTVTGVTQHLKLELIKGGGVNSVIATDMAPGTSSKDWTAAGAAASDYKLRVSAIGGSATGESVVFELKTCGGTGGLNPGDFHMGAKAIPKKLLQGQAGLSIQGLPVVVPGVYKNWPGRDSFPANVTGIPASVYEGVWNQVTPAVCYTGGSNHTALVGIYWFPYENMQVAVVYRSRIIFYLSEHVKPGATLESAKLKMKRIHSIHEDANSGCGCSENLWVLKEPWASYDIPAIGPRVDVDMGAAEFTRDVTQIVKQWLDGTVVNNGLLLLAGELPCSGGRKCFSCYEASLLLYMK